MIREDFVRSKVNSKKEVERLKEKAKAYERIKEQQKPVYLGDIESLMSQVASQVPLMNNETLLMSEIDTQNKVYGMITLIGLMMMAFAFLI